MKKLIASVVIALSFSFSAMAAPVFGHWTINDKGDAMVNNFEDTDGTTISLQVWGKGGIFLGFTNDQIKGKDVGKMTDKVEAILTVNGKRVVFWAMSFESGFNVMTPKNDEGKRYVASQLWDKKKVTFVNSEGSTIWFSAQGIQRGWDYLQSNEAI